LARTAVSKQSFFDNLESEYKIGEYHQKHKGQKIGVGWQNWGDDKSYTVISDYEHAHLK
jgi:hypothetical protein